MAEPEQEMKPCEDPIVAEVRSARDALFAASAYYVGALCRRLRENQQTDGR